MASTRDEVRATAGLEHDGNTTKVVGSKAQRRGAEAAKLVAPRALGLEPGNGKGAPYMPHLSLVYGDLTETERERARKDAAAAFFLMGDGDRKNASHAASFDATEVSLWRTDVQDLSCESWSRVDRYPLRAAPSE